MSVGMGFSWVHGFQPLGYPGPVDMPLLPLASEYIQNTISDHPMILCPLWCYFAILQLTLHTWTHIAEWPNLITFYISICSSNRFDFISLSLNMFHSKLLLYIFIPPFLLSPPWNLSFCSLSIFSVLFLRFLCIYLHSLIPFVRLLYIAWFIFEPQFLV